MGGRLPAVAGQGKPAAYNPFMAEVARKIGTLQDLLSALSLACSRSVSRTLRPHGGRRCFSGFHSDQEQLSWTGGSP